MKSRNIGIYTMSLPALALMVCFVFIPLAKGIRMSLTNWDGFSQEFSFIGLDNYRNLFTDRKIIKAIANTFRVGFGDTVLQNIFGLTYAMLLNRKFKGRSVARAFIYMPVMISSLIMGYIWFFIVQYDNGALNDIVMLLGYPSVDWLGDGSRAVNFIMVITSMQFVGQAMVIYLAGLQSIPKDMYEAPDIDGANGIQKFFYITLPMLKPAIITTVTLKLIGGLQMYDLVVALTNGGPGFSSHTISTMINYLYLNAQNAGYSSALGVFLFLIIMCSTLLANRFMERNGG